MSFLCHPQIAAKLCHAAYFDDEDSVRGLVYDADIRFEEVHLLQKDNAACVVSIHPHCIVVAFRGTDEGKDWLDNLDAEHTNDWHKGFQKHYDKLSLEWLRILHDNPSKPVYFTGHSLGGAVAVIAACEMVFSSGCITFGAPRVMWKGSQVDKQFNFPMLRVTRAADPVPHLPSRWRFKHIGHWLFIDHKGKSHHPHPSLWVRFNSAVRELVFKHDKDPHHITRYIQDLEVKND